MDSTVNPVKVLWRKISKPDYQSVVGVRYDTLTDNDLLYKETE